MIKVSIDREFNRTVILHRFMAGSYVDGIWIDGNVTDSEIMASVQPLTAGDYRRLPGGNTGQLGWKLFWSSDFQFGDEVNKLIPDQITVDGIRFEMVGKPDAWIKNGHSAALFIEIKN